MEFEERARAVLPPHISAYYAAPAGSEADLDEGTLDWSAIRFRPRVLRDIALPTSRRQSSVRPYGHRFWSRRWRTKSVLTPTAKGQWAALWQQPGPCSACQPTPPFLCCQGRHRRAVVVPGLRHGGSRSHREVAGTRGRAWRPGPAAHRRHGGTASGEREPAVLAGEPSQGESWQLDS